MQPSSTKITKIEILTLYPGYDGMVKKKYLTLLALIKRGMILPAIRRRQERSRWRVAPRTCTRAPGCSP
jgi:hypothetical protein